MISLDDDLDWDSNFEDHKITFTILSKNLIIENISITRNDD